jgi:uncharacterized protein (DUF2336 family)
MTDRSSELHFLIELALDRSIAGRERLAEHIGDLCSGDHRSLSEQERDLIAEILKKLLSDFEQPIRERLSHRLAKSRDAPHDLIVNLANDTIEVAKPVLMESGLLRDPDLIGIVHHRGRQHQIAVACRRNLSEAVADALVEEGDEDVIKTLLENEDARIPEATMAYLVEESKRVDSFQEPLVNRPDLPPQLAEKLYWWVAAALRERILDNFDIQPTELDDAMEQTVGELSKDRIGEGEQTTPDTTAADELAKAIAAKAPITPDLMLKVLRRGEIPLFESLFGEASKLKPPILQRVLYDMGGEGLAIACRALQMPKQTFATIFMLTRSDGKVMKPRDLSRATKLFDSVSHDNAMEVLKSWQRDPDYQDAIERLRAGGARTSGGER